MNKLLRGIVKEIKKESLYPWWRNQGAFLLISFSLHVLIILYLFHLPLYSHQFSLPKIIEVKIIEENNRAAEVSTAKITPTPVIEKAKKARQTNLKKTKPLQEKIKPAHNPIPLTEKVILDNLDMESAREKVAQLSDDDTWLNEEIIFPDHKTNMKIEENSPLPNPADIGMAVNSIPEESKSSEKIGASSALPAGGTGSDLKTAISLGGVWLEGGSEGKGNFMAPTMASKGGDGKSSGSANLGQSPGHVYSKISGKKGDSPGDLATFLGMARKKIEGAKRYPWEALRRNWQGKVILSFWVDQKGEVSEIKILQSSGYKVLDEEAKATLLRASPLPVPPQMEEEMLKIEVPILFRIE
ncbi:MAG: energy transducer TonB [Thermodesulfobacteriota bacterium]